MGPRERLPPLPLPFQRKRVLRGLLVTTLAIPLIAGPGIGAAEAKRRGGTALEEFTDVVALLLGLRGIHAPASELRALAAKPASDALLRPAAAVDAAASRIKLTTGRRPFAVVHNAGCPAVVTAYQRAARLLTAAARQARTGNPTGARSTARLGRALLARAWRLEPGCRKRSLAGSMSLTEAVPRPAGRVSVTGFSFTRSAPLVAQISARGTLTGAACPDPADEQIAVVISFSGVQAGTAVQAALTRYPSTGPPSVSAGVTLAEGAGTAAAGNPASDLRAGTADGNYVAVVALNGHPVAVSGFTVACG